MKSGMNKGKNKLLDPRRRCGASSLAYGAVVGEWNASSLSSNGPYTNNTVWVPRRRSINITIVDTNATDASTITRTAATGPGGGALNGVGLKLVKNVFTTSSKLGFTFPSGNTLTNSFTIEMWYSAGFNQNPNFVQNLFEYGGSTKGFSLSYGNIDGTTNDLRLAIGTRAC
jgi:hypothetical protein